MKRLLSMINPTTDTANELDDDHDKTNNSLDGATLSQKSKRARKARTKTTSVSAEIDTMTDTVDDTTSQNGTPASTRRQPCASHSGPFAGFGCPSVNNTRSQLLSGIVSVEVLEQQLTVQQEA